MFMIMYLFVSSSSVLTLEYKLMEKAVFSLDYPGGLNIPSTYRIIPSISRVLHKYLLNE